MVGEKAAGFLVGGRQAGEGQRGTEEGSGRHPGGVLGGGVPEAMEEMMNENGKYWLAFWLFMAIALVGVLVRDGVRDAGCLEAWAVHTGFGHPDCETRGLW